MYAVSNHANLSLTFPQKAPLCLVYSSARINKA